MAFKESEILELKKSTSELKDAIISIASILNKHQKGEIYFGIKNDGTITGLDVSEQTIRDVSKTISDNIEPKIYPKISKVNLNGADCIHVEFQGNNAPYYAYGRAYMRVGDEDRQLSAKELEDIILRKNKDKMRWDTQICEKAKLEDISSVKLKKFLKISGLKYDTIKNSLEKLRLVSDGKLLNAALILFGKKPQSFFPNAKLRCAVFGTTDTSFTIDMKDFEGDLFYLIEKAEDYVLNNIHIGMRLEGLRRVDVPEIDKEAFREAIINAFCHRDYYEYDSVNIAIFKDRVEIRNPGKLYGGLTIDEIIRENVSKRRNELIADMFNKVHFVEKWGRGIELILSKEPQTTFKEVADMFVAVFKRKAVERVTERDTVKDTEKVGEKVGEEGGERLVERVERLVDGLVENQKKMLDLMKKDPYISKKELSLKLGISSTAIDKNIISLKKKGLLRRIGADRGGYWEVVGG